MPTPTVVIELAASDRASPFAPELVDACSRGVFEGRCALAGGSGDEDALAIAIVSWSGPDRTSVRVEVGRKRGQPAQWLTRTVQFAREDLVLDRWRAIGLVIATLVGETLRPPEPKPVARAPVPAPPPPAPPAVLVRERPAPRPALPPARAWVDAMLTMGPGLSGGSWRRGATARGAWSFAPAWFIAGALRYEATPSDDAGVAAQWASLALGGGTFVDALERALRLELDAAVVTELVRASVAAQNADDSASRNTFGARLGATGAWTIAPPVALLLRSDVQWTSATAVQVRSASVGRDVPFGYTFSCGARFAWR